MNGDPRELIARRMALQGPVYAGRPPAKRHAAIPEASDPSPPPERPLMLDFVLASGNRVSMSYAYLNTIEYDPSEGLTLRFMQGVVTITGSRLLPLYELLRDHLARVVEEQTGGPFESADGQPATRTLITRISVKHSGGDA